MYGDGFSNAGNFKCDSGRGDGDDDNEDVGDDAKLGVFMVMTISAAVAYHT